MSQVFPLTYVLERAKADARRVKFIEIYRGLLSEKANTPLFQRIDKISGTDDWGSAFDFFKANCFGDFTARFSPSGEIIWFNNAADGAQPGNTTFPGAYAMQGLPMNAAGQINYQELMNMHMQNLQVIVDLRQQLNKALDDLTRLKSTENKLGYVVDKFFHNLQNNRSGQPLPLNGKPQMQSPQQSAQGTEDALENSLGVLVQLLGEEGIHKAAQKLQNDPATLSFLLNYLSQP